MYMRLDWLFVHALLCIVLNFVHSFASYCSISSTYVVRMRLIDLGRTYLAI